MENPPSRHISPAALADLKGLHFIPRTWQSFPIEQFVGHADLSESSPRPLPVTLDNEVHPTFASSKFCAAFEYGSVLPALRFASLLIETPAIMDYWYAAFLFTPDEVEYIDRAETYEAILRKGSPLSSDEIARIRACFLALAANVNFSLVDAGLEAQGCTYVYRHEPLRAHPPADDERIPQWHGHPSIIYVSSGLCETITNSAATFAREPNRITSKRLTTAYFTLATTIVHELAHAVYGARWGAAENVQIPFESQLVGEDGFDWEATVFGGHIRRPDEEGIVLMTEWPCASQGHEYIRRGNSSVAVLAPWTVASPESDAVWQVSPTFVATMFRKKFWNDTVQALGAAAFQPQKIVGFRRAHLLPTHILPPCL